MARFAFVVVSAVEASADGTATTTRAATEIARSLRMYQRVENPQRSGRGLVAHPVFKTGRAWQPHAWKVRFLRRSVAAIEQFLSSSLVLGLWRVGAAKALCSNEVSEQTYDLPRAWSAFLSRLRDAAPKPAQTAPSRS